MEKSTIYAAQPAAGSIFRRIVTNAVPLYERHARNLNVAFKILLVASLIVVGWKFHHQLFEAVTMSFTIGWMALLVPCLFIVWNFFATYAWQSLLRAITNDKKPDFLKLFAIRIQGQALNQVLPMFGLGGEALRSARVSGECGVRNSITSVAADKSVDILAEAALAFVGGMVAAQLLPFPALFFFLSLAGITLIAGLFLFWEKNRMFVCRRWPFRWGREMVETLSGIKTMRRGTLEAFIHHTVEHALMAGEILLIARLLGIDLGLRELLLVNTVSSAFSLLFVFIPGRVGAYECSVAFAFSLLSIAPSSGISVALIRRARQLLVCLVGCILLVANKRLTYRQKMSVPVPSA